MSTEMEKAPQRQVTLRQPVGLKLSIGDEKAGNRPGGKIDYFRPKAGQQGEYQEAMEKFLAHYGPTPRVLDDVYLLSNEVGDVLDVRIKWWGKIGMKGAGLTNFATLSPQAFTDRVEAWDDEVFAFLDDRPAPVHDKLHGPTDPRIGRYEMHVETTLKFMLPEVLGLGTVVEVMTKGRRSRHNLYQGVTSAHQFLGGNLVGPRFRLRVRPARSRYWQAGKDDNPGKWSVSEFYELVFDTALTVGEIREEIAQHRLSLGTASPVAAIEAPRDPAAFLNEVAAGEAAVMDLPAVAVGSDDEDLGEGEVQQDSGSAAAPPSPAVAVDDAATPSAVAREAAPAPPSSEAGEPSSFDSLVPASAKRERK